MNHRRWAAIALLAAGSAGCTTLREVPRSEYAAKPKRQNVQVTTHEGLSYHFDFTRVQGDTLVGFAEREDTGPVPEVAEVTVPLAEVSTLSVRTIDWFRTGLVGGGVVAGLIAASVGKSGSDESGTPTPGPPKTGPGDERSRPSRR